jgi:ubiquinone/menaquinone biosynthesis C-methylase UbiE
MDHQDHIRLLRGGITSPGGKWAELGSGRGAFTFALAELVGPGGIIYSVDKNSAALKDQARAMQKRNASNQPAINYLHMDYRQPLSLPALDGVLMANTLHFLEDKTAVLKRIKEYLHPGGSLILVEYNSDQGNRWVPFPISFVVWKSLVKDVGFEHTRLMERVPSSFMGEIYSAQSWKINIQEN